MDLVKNPMDSQWMAVYTKPRSEKKAYDQLLKKEFEVFLPLRKTLKQWSDRKKWIEEVVIPSYLFIRCTEKQRFEILQEPHVLNFVYWLGKPAIIRDEEIQALKDFINNVKAVNIEIKQFEKGQKVVIAGGLLKEKSGVVVARNNNQVSIQIESLGMALIAKIDTADVQLME